MFLKQEKSEIEDFERKKKSIFLKNVQVFNRYRPVGMQVFFYLLPMARPLRKELFFAASLTFFHDIELCNKLFGKSWTILYNLYV